MGLISGSIASLANGVSQQPSWMRLPSQAEAQENAFSSLVEGMKRRPPTEHVARLSASAFGNVHLHTIVRDQTERYNVVISNGDLKVYDLAGNQKTVNFPNGKAYLNASDPKTAFTCTTISDFTFVTNKTVTVTEATAGLTGLNHYFVYVKQAFYNCNYNVYLNGGLVGTYTTAAAGNQPQTDAIAAALAISIAASLPGWTVGAYGSCVIFYTASNPSYPVVATDSQGNQALVAYNKTIQNFVDLPPNAINDPAVIEVIGSSTNAFDSYYVTFNQNTASWDETVKPDDKMRPEPTTMPWKLVREVGGDFTFDKIDWGWRTAGDATSAPKPSFIGHTIADVVVHRNRLCLISDQNAVASRPGGENYFSFYPTTVTTSLDSDPIDVGVNSNQSAVPLLRHAVPFNEDLLLFADPAQFVMKGGDTLSPSTVKLTQTTAFAASLTAKPATTGRFVYFAITKGGNSGIREFFVDSQSLTNDALDVTIHVPTYITGTVTKMVAVPNEDTLLVLADGETNAIWIYKTFVENNQKLQSSWSKWLLPTGEKVLNIAVAQSDVFIVIERATGVFLERLRLDASYVDTGVGFAVRLDRKCSATGTYDSGNNWTTWTLPYDLTGMSVVGVFGGSFTGKIGFEMPTLTVVNAAAGTVRLTGNHSAGACIFGRRFTTLYRLSTITVATASQDGKGRQALTDGQLRLRNIFVNYGSAGAFKVKVTPTGRSTYTYTFAPNVLGQTLTVGSAVLDTGRFRVPIQAKNDEVVIDIESDSHYPCAILSIDWEAEFTLRSRRM